MSGGGPAPLPLPPVPDLIPIAALRGSPTAPAAAGGRRRAAAGSAEVMGEQRPRRRAQNQPAAELIDSRAGSRGPGAAPQPPPPPPHARKTRSERHRKSDRRREHRKDAAATAAAPAAAATRSAASKHRRRSRDARGPPSPERPANPRVNPIFVWVRQEDTRIVDVKCEDYDKRNRILLTKTAQGWRAIPRTETLVPSLRDAAERGEQPQQQPQPQAPGHGHGRQKRARSRKAKLRQRSTSVQFPEEPEQADSDAGHDEPDADADADADDAPPPPPATATATSWISDENVNVESLLPSHTIHVKRSSSPPERSPRPDFENVNSAVEDNAQTPPPVKCTAADKVCDVSPLDNLLAVAELEFKQQIQSGEWNKSDETEITNGDGDADANDEPYNGSEVDENQSQFIDSMEQLSDLIESEGQKVQTNNNDAGVTETKSDECDYNENDDENNMAMNDILSRLEQSLQSPECAEVNNGENNKDCDSDSVKGKSTLEELEIPDNKETNECDSKSTGEVKEAYEKPESELKMNEDEFVPIKKEEKPDVNNLVESSTNDEDQDQPTDLSIKNKPKPLVIEGNCDTMEEPTDLSIPKVRSSPPREIRPPSQNSEAIQSPEPSGIPAVPPSPDIVSTSSTNSSKVRSMFLDSLLSSTSQKIALNSEVTITRQKEPLDLGASRKSASPTVTCSEEVSNATPSDIEPPLKKFKSNDITLKTLLDAEVQKPTRDNKSPSKEIASDIPRLLDLLDTDSDLDPVSQYKQLLTEVNIPDPIMVPQQWFGEILKNPRREILRIMREKPCKSLPPDEVLILYKDKLLAALEDNYYKNIENNKASSTTSGRQHSGKSTSSDSSRKKQMSENNSRQSISAEAATKNMSANDIDAAEAAFNQMLWLPYANHMDALAFANNQDVLKALYSSFPMFPNDLSLMFGGRLPMAPVNFPPLPTLNYENQFSFWTEAMLNNGMKNKIAENPMLKQSSSSVSPSSGNKKNSSGSLPMHNNLPKQQAFPSCTNGGPLYQNPFLNTPQHKQSLQIPQYQPFQKAQQKTNNFHHKQKDASSNFFSQMSEHEKQLQYLQSLQHNANAFNYQQRPYQLQQQQHMRQQMQQKHHRGNNKGASGNFAGSASSAGQKYAAQQHQEKMDALRQQTATSTNQPIDLSGSTCGAKHKVKSAGSDSASRKPSSKHHEDVPEVGSTTASIEEMQDAHKHLWHPLFGNSKNYSPWALPPSVAATGE